MCALINQVKCDSGFFVHAKSSARKGMKMPIKEKPVHIRIIWVSGILRDSLRESIRHSISRSNLEWARDLEEKSWRRILNPFALELTWDTLKLSTVYTRSSYIYFEKSYRLTSRALSKKRRPPWLELNSNGSNRDSCYMEIIRMCTSLHSIYVYRILFKACSTQNPR